MSKKKNKERRFVHMIDNVHKLFGLKRTLNRDLKDIDGNRKHNPKGSR